MRSMLDCCCAYVCMASMRSNSAPRLAWPLGVLKLMCLHRGTPSHLISSHLMPTSRVPLPCLSLAIPFCHVTCCDGLIDRSLSVWQLRKVAACEAALERVVLEADEALVTHGQMGRTGSDQVHTAASAPSSSSMGLFFAVFLFSKYQPGLEPRKTTRSTPAQAVLNVHSYQYIFSLSLGMLLLMFTYKCLWLLLLPHLLSVVVVSSHIYIPEVYL